jgi:nicotinate-nucleotide pyrophosphorylase (carboxylating)
MSPAAMRAVAVALKGRVQIEASGGITLANLRAVAATGVQRISIGALTHSAPVLDLSLELVP